MRGNTVNAAKPPDRDAISVDRYGSSAALFKSAGLGGQIASVSRLFLLILVTVGGFIEAAGALAQTEPSSALPAVVDSRVSTTPQRGRLILDLSAPTQFAIVALDKPDRIAIDVRASSLKFVSPADIAGNGLVQSYTVELAEAGRVRTILTLNGPAQVQQAYVLDAVADQPARLVVDLIPDTAEGFGARVAADLNASRANEGAAPAIASTDPGTHTPVRANRPLVVIDPGHGGVDNGASAPNGVHEKDITLAFALQLQELLIASGRFDVALTREDDTYLTLNQRVALARMNKADLFLSLHADSFQEEEIRGASVYTRDERATDMLDRVLAENENKSDLVAGFAMPEMAPAVVDILVDLMRRQMRRQSFLAAQAVVHQLEPSVALRRFPVRQADFFVLQAPDVPSILVELGFLSNASDIANLQKSDWRDRVVNALARGIASYFNEVEAPVAAAP